MPTVEAQRRRRSSSGVLWTNKPKNGAISVSAGRFLQELCLPTGLHRCIQSIQQFWLADDLGNEPIKQWKNEKNDFKSHRNWKKKWKKTEKKLGFLQKCQQKQMVSRNWKKTRNLGGVKRSNIPRFFFRIQRYWENLIFHKFHTKQLLAPLQTL